MYKKYTKSIRTMLKLRKKKKGKLSNAQEVGH